jgi:threonine dehydratase
LEANVVRIHHNRIFTHSAFWETEVDVVLETRNREHVEHVLEGLEESGYRKIEILT